jgi:hypothetical protein
MILVLYLIRRRSCCTADASAPWGGAPVFHFRLACRVPNAHGLITANSIAIEPVR